MARCSGNRQVERAEQHGGQATMLTVMISTDGSSTGARHPVEQLRQGMGVQLDAGARRRRLAAGERRRRAMPVGMRQVGADQDDAAFEPLGRQQRDEMGG